MFWELQCILLSADRKRELRREELSKGILPQNENASDRLCILSHRIELNFLCYRNLLQSLLSRGKYLFNIAKINFQLMWSSLNVYFSAVLDRT